MSFPPAHFPKLFPMTRRVLLAVVRTGNLGHGIQQAVALLGEKPVAGKDALLILDLKSVGPYPFRLATAGDPDSRRFADQLSEQLAYG